MTKTRHMRWLVILLMTAACTSGGEGETTTSGDQQTSTTGGDGGDTTTSSADGDGGVLEELIIVQGSEPASMAPDVDAITTSRRFTWHIFDTCTRYAWNGDQLELVPWLCESWEQVDPTTWRFTLRDGITFHNGEPLTAEAFEFTLETYKNNQAMLSTIFADRTITAVDDLTFDVVTDVENLQSLPASMSAMWVYPPQYYQEVGMEEFGNDPVGTGPYQFVSWEKGVEIRIEAVEDWWGPTQPQIQTIVHQAVAEASSRVALLETGDAHLVTDLPPELGDRVDASDGSHTVTIPSTRRFFLMFNTFLPPTDDPLVRQAVNYAIDRDALRNELFSGFAGEFNGVFVPGEAGFDPDFEGYPHDVERARELLAEAGYGDGVEIDLNYPIGNYTLDAATNEALVAMLAEAGITANLNGGPISEISQLYATQEAPGMSFFTFAPLWLDPSFVGLVHFTSSSLYRYNFTDQQDALLAEALAEQDADVREETYRDIQESLIMDRAVWAPLFTQVDIYGVSDLLDWDHLARPDQMLDLHLIGG